MALLCHLFQVSAGCRRNQSQEVVQISFAFSNRLFHLFGGGLVYFGLNGIPSVLFECFFESVHYLFSLADFADLADYILFTTRLMLSRIFEQLKLTNKPSFLFVNFK